MTLQQLYDRGYAIGTGARVRHIPSGGEYIMANTDEYEWAAIDLTFGNRWRDACKFSCAFQADLASVANALGNLALWEKIV